MEPRNVSGFRLRLTAGLAAMVLVLAIAWAWSLFGPLRDAVTTQQEQRLGDVARSAAVMLPSANLSLPEGVDRVAEATTVRITVIGSNGTVLADSEEATAALENHGDRPEVIAALTGRTGVDVRRSETQGIQRVYVAVPAEYRGERIVVRASEPLTDVLAISESMRRAGLIALLVALALAATTAWFLTRTTAGPVERLMASAQSMAGGDLETAVPVLAGPLAPLSGALAALRDSLRARIETVESEERTLRSILNDLDDAVFLLDSGRVRMANRALTTMFRLPPDDLAGRDLSAIGLPESIASAIAERLSAPARSTVVLGPDPFLRYHRVTVVPIGGDEGSLGRLVVIADLTARMRFDAVRRDFVANASHELKTPVAAMVLLSESAESAARDGDMEQALAFLGHLTAEAERLRRLVSDLLDLSRLESVPSSDEVTDIRRAIELALAGHQRAAAAKHLALSSDLSAVAGQDVAVRTGSTDVAIVLDNLLSNAVAYTETGSVAVRVSADDRTVTIEVADTGIGIPPESIDRVFERFYRVDQARSRTSGGTGLGLSLVRNVAEAAGGSASIASEVGQGTTVTLRLPRAK